MLKKIKQIASRVTGVSTPVLGVSWKSTDGDTLLGFDSGSVEVDRNFGNKGDCPVFVHSVREPANSMNVWYKYLDVFLQSQTKKDVLFVKVTYSSWIDIPRGDGSDSGTVEPMILYELGYEMGGKGELLLDPPFLLKPKDLRCIRFHFHPAGSDGETIEYMTHHFSFDLVDSAGRNKRIL